MMEERAMMGTVINLNSKTLQADVQKINKLFASNEDSQALLELERVLAHMEYYSQDVPPQQQPLLQGLLLKILTSMENKDYVRLADLLEYCLTPLFSVE